MAYHIVRKAQYYTIPSTLLWLSYIIDIDLGSGYSTYILSINLLSRSFGGLVYIMYLSVIVNRKYLLL